MQFCGEMNKEGMCDMVQIGIRLHDVEKGTIEERLPIVQRKGFSCVHLALSKTVQEYSVKNAALTPGYAMYLRKLFVKSNINIAVLGCYLNLANPNQKKLAEIQQTYYAHIRFASQLGCGVVGTETGAPNEAYVYESASHGEEALQTFIENLRPVIACAEKFGVVFAIEPVWNHIVYNSKRALEVLEAIDSPNLQIIFDPVNLLSLENYENREAVIDRAIEDLDAYIAVVHIKDFCIEQGKLISVAAGTGVMDYSQIMKFIKQEKPFVQVTLEDTVPENAEMAREFIQRVYDKA